MAVLKPYTFSAGASIIAAEHNSNFDALYNAVNGNLDTSSLKANANIVDTQLLQISTAGKVSGAALTSLASIPSGAGTIPAANLPTNVAVRSLYWYVAYPVAASTTRVGIAFTVPFAASFTKAWLNIVTGPTGSNLYVDIHKNGTTIWTTQTNRVQVAAGQTTGNTTTFDVTTLAANDVITAYVDAIGSTAIADLTIQLDITPT